MRTALPSLILLLCAACSSPTDNEVERLSIVKRTGDKAAICQQSRRVADAYLDARDEKKYQFAKLEADLACQDARLSSMG